MNFELYGDDSKGLIRLDPRTKILIFFASTLMSLNSYDSALMLICTGALCAVLALCGKPMTSLKSFALYGCLLYIRWCIESSGSSAPVVTMITEALITIFLYCFPVILSFIILIQTTRISQFLSAFQAMHLPMTVIIPVAVLFRFIPTVQDEWNGIRKAMAFRGIRLSPGTIIRKPFQTLEYVLIPLLFSSVSVMEELAAAASARGMDAEGKRSSYEEVKLHAADYLVMAVFVILIIYILYTARKIGG